FVAVGNSVGTETKIRKSQWPEGYASLASGISARLPASRPLPEQGMGVGDRAFFSQDKER
ncbi:MAG: hypothetical protein WBM76_09655, partial [Woeseiaceae bacterium]